MRVFVPYNPVDSDEEIAIKCSTDGQGWEEKEQIYQPNITNDFKVCTWHHKFQQRSQKYKKME